MAEDEAPAVVDGSSPNWSAWIRSWLWQQYALQTYSLALQLRSTAATLSGAEGETPVTTEQKSTKAPFPSPASPMDSTITLWQFLLELLQSGEHPHLIQWTNREGEFKLFDAEGVARLWGVRKAKPHMNYDKLSRALRYYYDKNIIRKVNGQKFVYRFVGYPDHVGQCAPSSSENVVPANGGRQETAQSQPHQHQLQQQQQQQPSQSNINLCLRAIGNAVQNFSSTPFPVCSLPSLGQSPYSSHPILGQSPMHSSPHPSHAAAPSSSLASAVHAGMLSAINSTPSPADSACSPSSVGSHSSTSVSCVSTGEGPSSSSNLAPLAPIIPPPQSAGRGGPSTNSSSASSTMLLSPPRPASSASRPSSTQQPMVWEVKEEVDADSRKRKTPCGGFDDSNDVKPAVRCMREDNRPTPLPSFYPTSSPITTTASGSLVNTPTSGGGTGGLARRGRPEPLNLSSVSTSMDNGVSNTTPPLPQIISPLVIPHNPNLVQLVNSLLSASLYGPNSPLAFSSPLFAPPAPQGMPTTPDSQMAAPRASTTPSFFQFPPTASPVHTMLSSLFSPALKTPTSQGIFQFPTSPHGPAVASLLSPAGSNPFMSSVFAHRYLGEDLKTPTATLKTPLPVNIKELK